MLSVGHLQLLVPRLLKHKNLKVHFYDFNSINVFTYFLINETIRIASFKEEIIINYFLNHAAFLSNTIHSNKIILFKSFP